MLNAISENWPVIAVSAAWLARERLNIVSFGAWLVRNGGVIGLARKLLLGNSETHPANSNAQ